MSEIKARDAGDLRKYRTEIPNLVLELGLSPYALALYVHLKRTAGQDGACYKERGGWQRIQVSALARSAMPAKSLKRPDLSRFSALRTGARAPK
jgi:hypothetical protein